MGCSMKKYIRLFMISILMVSFMYNEQVKAQFSKNGIHYIADTATNFNNLISKFKGKIIYVDVWATWCSPCRHELQKKKDIKAFADFALKNNIVILYICCDKNENSYKAFIANNNLIGYHILVNSYIDKDFHTTFSSVQNRKGVMKRSFYLPRHIIIDKSGIVADSTADSQGSPAVYAHLKKIIDQSAN
jgi:thiol-disulfide isomerase/thioredoxin